MDKTKCENCVNYRKHYIIHPVLGLRYINGGHCTMHSVKEIKKLDDCPSFAIDKKAQTLEDYFTILIKVKMQLNKFAKQIAKLETAIKNFKN